MKKRKTKKLKRQAEKGGPGDANGGGKRKACSC